MWTMTQIFLYFPFGIAGKTEKKKNKKDIYMKTPTAHTGACVY